MESQIEQKNFKRRKIAGSLFIAFLLLLLGRNLTFLPTINLSTASEEEDLKKITSEIIENKKGFYSVYFKDLKEEKAFGIDEKQINTASSVNKIPIIAALYYLDSIGELSLDQRITIQDKDKQDYGTGSLRYQKLPQTYSLRNLAKLTLRESDNTAAHVLAIRIGVDKIQKLVDSWGLKQTNMKNNKTSAYDMSILLQKIYDGEIANEAETEEFLDFLTDSIFEERLPKNLPSGVEVYHKTGDGEGFVHDVGIIETKDKAYYLGVMTSDIGEAEAETKNAIAQISKEIFDKISK